MDSMEQWRSDDCQGRNQSAQRKTYTTATSSTTNPTWTVLRLEPGLRGTKPQTIYNKVKGKGKVVPVLFYLTEHHAMKAYCDSGCRAPRILRPRH
jgi:hypothetical protein